MGGLGGKGVAAGGGIVGLVIVVLMSLLGGGGGGGGAGIDITDIFGQMNMGGSPGGTVDPADEPLVEEMSLALDDIQAFWSTSSGLGSEYQDAKLVLFTGGVSTGGCGNAPSSVGPFYCPADSKAYIDLSFFKELQSRFGATGDFARVYVLAHELGHHVQNLLGTTADVRREQEQNPAAANELSVRMELQADCYAGRSEEHTSELQSLMRNSYAVFCLKKKKHNKKKSNKIHNNTHPTTNTDKTSSTTPKYLHTQKTTKTQTDKT